MKKVVISILNYNGEKNTLECLQSVDKITTGKFQVQVIVVDNNSKKKFVIPKKFMKRLKTDIVYNKENLGFSGGHNTAIRIALEENADYILILNNDTIVDKNFLHEMLQLAEDNNKIGVVAPKIYFEKGHEFHKSRYTSQEGGKVIWYAGGIFDWDNIIGCHKGVDEVDVGQFKFVEETDFASGCCMLVKSEVLQKIGIFDERYFLYYEDNDLQERIKQKGYSIMFTPLSIIWHKNAGSVGGSGSVLQDYFISRNRLLFGLTYGRYRARFALIRESMRLLLIGRQYQKKGIRDFYLGRFGKGNFFSE